MGMWAQLIERWRRRQAALIERAAREDDAEDAQHARDRLLAVAQLQSIEPGTVLYLKSREWRRHVQAPLADRYRDIRVIQIHERTFVVDGMPWVLVTGRDLECSYEQSPCTHPAVTVLVRLDAVFTAGNR